VKNVYGDLGLMLSRFYLGLMQIKMETPNNLSHKTDTPVKVLLTSVDQHMHSVQKMYIKIILEINCNVSLFSC